jgi:tryptophanyl-tRNA synthetase
MSKTVLSGIRATGRLHFGNFFGAVRNFVNFQEQGDNGMYFIADLHTLTTLDDPDVLRGNIIEVAKDYLAAGLDPEKSTLYVQSSVPQVCEISLCLGMLQPLGELQTIPTFKDMVRKNPNRVSHGLISYPVLMAADILGAQADIVPVGEDQVPNVELARSLARRFNIRFGDILKIPSMMTDMVRIPGLDGGKMGKSDSAAAVNINDPIDRIRELYLKKGVTDPERIKVTDKGDPYNRCKSVYPMHEVATAGESDSREIANLCRSAKIGCRDCKLLLVKSLAEAIEPFQEARREIADKDDYVADVLAEGGKRARVVFQETLDLIYDAMGIKKY